MAFTNPWTENDPAGTAYVREVDDWIRRHVQAIRERADVEHYAYADETGKTNIWMHRPGSAKILAGLASAKPGNRSDAPGTLYYETDTGRIVYDSGSAWVLLAHKAVHAKGQPDAIAPHDIGALDREDTAGDSMAGPLQILLSLPSGVDIGDTPGAWPAAGLCFYRVTAAGQLQSQPAPYGVIMHIAWGGVRFQVFFNWIHPGAGNPPGTFWWRHAGDGDTAWSAWSKVWNDGNDGQGSGLDADTFRGTTPDAYAEYVATVSGKRASYAVYAP